MKRSFAPWTAPGEACHCSSTSNGCSTPATRLQSANSTLQHLEAAPLQRHPCSCKATQLHNPHSTLTAALQHPAAAPCNGTSNPAPKRKVRAHSVVCDDCSKVRSHIIVDLVEYAPRQVCGIRFLHLLNAPATLFSQEHQEE